MEADQKGDKPVSSAQIIMGASWWGRWGRARTRLAMDARRCRTAAGVPRAEGGEGPEPLTFAMVTNASPPPLASTWSWRRW